MARKDRPIWTDPENDILRQHCATLTFAELVPLLPGRNAKGIRIQAGRLNLAYVRVRPGAWSDEHIAMLREHYPTRGAAYVAALVGRSAGRVTGYAHDHNVPFMGDRNQGRKKARQYPAKKAVGRPKKPLGEAEAPAAPVVKVAPRKPIAAPVKASPGTPLLNARAAHKRQKEKELTEKPKPFVTAAEIRDLRADHPARWAYTRAGHLGPAAASKAFYEAMQQQG